MNDKEIELFVQALISPPPKGFTEAEKKQIMLYLKNPSAFLELAEMKQTKIQ